MPAEPFKEAIAKLRGQRAFLSAHVTNVQLLQGINRRMETLLKPERRAR
jgi:hypothetical protein